MKLLSKAIMPIVCLSFAATPTLAQEFTMRIAAGASSSGLICKTWFPAWAEKIKADSQGRIGYQIFCDGTLGKMGDTVNRVEQGVAEVGWDTPQFYGARFAQLGLVELPGLDASREDVAGAMWKTYESGAVPQVAGVKLAIIQANGLHTLWTSKPLEDATSLEGLKIGVASKKRALMIEKMGGVPVTLRATEVYQAMSRGTIDGVLTSAAAVFDLDISDVAKYNYRDSLGGGVTIVVLNQAWYDSLPDDLKAVIDNNIGYETSKSATAAILQDERETYQKKIAEAGLVVRTATEQEHAAWQPAIDAAIESWLAEAPERKGYLEAFKKELAQETGN